VTVRHRTKAELEQAIDVLTGSPPDEGTVEMIVRRPARDRREVLDRGEITHDAGLVGDRWSEGESPNPDAQVTLMNARVIEYLAGTPDRWPLAGDQLFVDLDLSVANLPGGSRLRVGSAVIELTEPPHTGCAKFAERFGIDSARFVNSELGRQLRLRGANARVVEQGWLDRGDHITRI
jgi:MOSC domain-containing protein YiiM